MTTYESPQQSAYNSSVLPEGIKIQLQNAKELAVNRLLRPNSFSNIVGVGLGRKIVDDEVTDTRCVRIYVQFKQALKDLNPSAVVPASFLDIPTDIIEVGRLGRLGNQDDLRDDDTSVGTGPGSSIRLETTSPNVNQGAPGTLGAVVKDGQASYILSCNHVLSVNGRVLSDPTASVVTPALSAKTETIAQPTEHFVELKRRKKNLVDCAIASVGGPSVAKRKAPIVNADFRVAAGAGLAGAAAAAGTPLGVPDRGQKVKKDGATTGRTSGTVVDVDADFYVEYSFGTFFFTNQVVIEGDTNAFATEGDSGSIVIDTTANQAIAMIFAESGGYAIACPLESVINELQNNAKVPVRNLAWGS